MIRLESIVGTVNWLMIPSLRTNQFTIIDTNVNSIVDS